MAINQVPTLILGIGGIGCRIAANINELLRPEDREHIAIVGMDTNVNDLAQLESRGIRTIQTSDDRTVGEYLRMHPEYMSWFPVNQFTVSRGMLNGAGQIRAISRLAALAAEENGMFIPIKEEIKRIRENRGQSSSGNLTVMVVGSITGGTGAGLFLQMPFYIRKVMRDASGLNIIIRGMFIGADLTADVQPSKINRDAVRVNGYTCLKELNALYMRQTHPDTEGTMKVDFYEPEDDTQNVMDDITRTLLDSEYATEDIDAEAFRTDAAVVAKGNPDIPYDYLYLIEGDAAKGGIGNAPLDHVESLAARMVHTLMFTPVSSNALSVEDNMVLQDMEKGGMNRYSSAGLSRMIYPRDVAREYVTLCTVRDLVQEEWMIIDNGYNDQVQEARSLQKSDGQVVIPKLQDAFVELFAKETTDEGKLGTLFKEAFIVSEDHEVRSRAVDFLAGLNEQIEKVVGDGTEADAARIACAMNSNKMDTFEAAIKESARIYNALEDYGKMAKRLVKEKPASVANELFPPSWQSMRSKKNNSYCIYGLLAGVHPLTARFLCYDLLRQMEARYEELEGTVASLNLEEYQSEDFDSKEEKIQTATVALKLKQKKQIPVLSAIVGDASSIKKIKIRLQGMADSQSETITQYLTQTLEMGALRILITRVKALAENYRIFFQGIENMINENNTRIKELENLKMPLRQEGVYCSKEAFEAMAAEYRNSADIALPKDTKSAIFENLFKIMADDFAREGKVLTERQKTVYAAKKSEALNGIFRTAVVDTIRTDVTKNGAGIVDMTVYQALEKQYELELPEDMDFTTYLRSKVASCMLTAAPMLATSSNAMAENTETVYIAVHPGCAATEMGEPNAGATQMLLMPQACDASDGIRPTVLLDESFSPYEITCFKARYKFAIEDLVKYAPGSENAKAYRTRIGNLGKMPAPSNDAEAFKTVVNPHLDRYWHEIAYVPSIYANERRRDRVDVLKAFIYAMGLDCFDCMVDESALDERGEPRKSWYFNGRNIPVTVRGGRIGGSFVDLYKALPFNSRICKDVLKIAQITMKAEKSYYDVRELREKILEVPFVEDLTQPTVREDDQEKNILDIILEMRDAMNAEDWKQLFVGLREALWEFCAFLFDENERIVNETVRSIMEAMLANSKISGKDAKDMSYAEREVKSQVAAICATVYRKN